MVEPVEVARIVTDSPLRAILVAYLYAQNFHVAANGLWGHPELGEGRTFEQVVSWQIGRERTVSGRSA